GRIGRHSRPMALVPFIFRWGHGTSSDILRRSAVCSRYPQDWSGLNKAFHTLGDCRSILTCTFRVKADRAVVLNRQSCYPGAVAAFGVSCPERWLITAARK